MDKKNTSKFRRIEDYQEKKTRRHPKKLDKKIWQGSSKEGNENTKENKPKKLKLKDKQKIP